MHDGSRERGNAESSGVGWLPRMLTQIHGKSENSDAGT